MNNLGRFRLSVFNHTVHQLVQVGRLPKATRVVIKGKKCSAAEHQNQKQMPLTLFLPLLLLALVVHTVQNVADISRGRHRLDALLQLLCSLPLSFQFSGLLDLPVLLLSHVLKRIFQVGVVDLRLFFPFGHPQVQINLTSDLHFLSESFIVYFLLSFLHLESKSLELDAPSFSLDFPLLPLFLDPVDVSLCLFDCFVVHPFVLSCALQGCLSQLLLILEFVPVEVGLRQKQSLRALLV